MFEGGRPPAPTPLQPKDRHKRRRISLFWRACLLLTGAVLVGAVGLALLTGSTGDRPGLGGSGAGYATANATPTGAAIGAGSSAITRNGVPGTPITAVSRRPAASRPLEHSSRVSEATSSPASAVLFPLLADALAPPGGGRRASRGDLRDDSLTTFDDPSITVDIVGQGTWTLTGNTTGDDCSSSPMASGASCDANTTDTVQVVATPVGHPTATTWSGDSCDNVTIDECDFTVGSNPDNETVTFTDTITTATSGTGTVAVADSPNSSYDCSASSGAACSVVDGDQITLTPTPAAHYQFSSWSGDECNGSTNATCSFTATGDATVTANFVPITHTITTRRAPPEPSRR